MRLAGNQSRAEFRVTSLARFRTPEFFRLLEEIGRERLGAFVTEDFLVLGLVHRERPVPDLLRPRLEPLLDQGIIERIGRGRGVRYLLPHRFYRFLSKPGVYTPRRGLDRETNKVLLLGHVQESADAGATLGELQEVLPGLSRYQVQPRLRELKGEGQIRIEGERKELAGFQWP